MPGESAGNPARQAVFVRVHGYLYNIDRGTARLLRLLRASSAPLGIIQWDSPLLSKQIRSSAIYILAAIGLKCIRARMTRSLGHDANLVSLPDRGDVAMFCFPNRVRIFDLGAQRIVNICNPGTPESRERLREMVAIQERLGQMSLAPRILGREQDDDYLEELCDGMPLRSAKWWGREVFARVTAAARQVQAAEPADARSIDDMTKELKELVSRLEASYREVSGQEADAALISVIRAACDGAGEGSKVEQRLSHGDLARRNVLVRRDGSMVFIDWDTVGLRITDYDVYNFHFSVVEDGATDRIPEATVFQWLVEALGIRDPEQAMLGLNRFKVEYFITRCRHFLLAPDADASRMSAVLAQMAGYTRCFRRFEEYCRSALPVS